MLRCPCNSKPIATLILCSGLVISSGCVALSIPSERYHDEADRGGMFGPQRGANAERNCESDLFTDADDFQESEKPAEVPWPRFHPLPTRPVFAP